MIAPPTGVTVPAAAAPDVAVSWTAGVGGVVPTGYVITRRVGGTPASPACGSSPTSLVTATSCTDTGVPDGTYTYLVTAVYRSWTAPSAPSGQVVVENAVTVAFVTQPTDTQATGPITPAMTVALRTADGDPFPRAGVQITLAIAANPAAGVLTGTKSVGTDATGVATFTGLSINNPGSGYTLTATSPGLTAGVSDPFAVSAPAFLGAAQYFSVLAGTAVVNTGQAHISGDVGVSPGTSVTGFPPGAVGGDIHIDDQAAVDAQLAFGIARTDLLSRPATTEIIGDLGGRTLPSGVYHSTAALALTGILTLNGDANAVFVFQSDAAFNTAAASEVVLTGGARAANVYWVVTGAAGTGANSNLAGTILATGAITLGAGTQLIGRALSRGTVTLAGNTIRFTDALPPTITIDGGAEATTKNTAPTVTGTSTAPITSRVTVRLAGQILQTTVAAGGTWSVTAATLGAGNHEMVASVRDAAGNSTAVVQLLTVEVNPDPVELGSAADYAVLASAVTSTGATAVAGDLGANPGPVVGFPPGIVNGALRIGGADVATAQNDLTAALDDGSSRPAHTEVVGDLGGRTFHIGVHHITAALALTGTVTLDAQDDPNAIFIFRTDAAFNTAALAQVVLANGTQASNVYWVVTGAAGTGANSVLAGTILAGGAITLGAGTQLTGRVLTPGAVTLAGNLISFPSPAAFSRQATETSTDVGSDSAESSTETSSATAPGETIITVEASTQPPAESVSSTTSSTRPEDLSSPTGTTEPPSASASDPSTGNTETGATTGP